MPQLTELWVDRTDIRTTKIVHSAMPNLADGEVLVTIDKFGLTANNVSYAVSGDFIGYWKYYPAEDNWGKVPVWGCANVVESKCPDVPVGERLWGFFPMANSTVLKPGKVTDKNFIDVTDHRTELPALYNIYSRTKAEPEVLQTMENERCLLFPLFATSYILYDYLLDNNLFGADQILIGSASSKTGFGLAYLLQQDKSVSAKVVGITSKSNTDFVKRLNCCDEIVIYGDEDSIDRNVPAAYIDMSGDLRLTKALHTRLEDHLVESAMVGASHWEDGGKAGILPGAKPKFFFAPGQIAKRDQEWGPGVIWQKAMMASAGVAQAAKDEMTLDWTTNVDDLARLWLQLLDNQIPASRGLMVSLIH